MSIIIEKVWSINSPPTPTDVTSYTLQITRTDTGEVLFPAGTAMSRTATGTYQFSFDAPTPGLTYAIVYVIVFGGQTYTLPDTYVDSGEEFIPLPPLTGDNLQDTINSLIVERLRVARNGPRVDYSLDGQVVKWTEYLKQLDSRIVALQVQIAQSQPWEVISRVY